MNIIFIHSYDLEDFILGKKEDIFTAAHELFSKNGFKNVSVSDITNLSGISVGSFYNYYDSKEALFFEVYHAENEKRKERIIKSLNLSAKPDKIAQEFLLCNMEIANNSLILCEWYGNSIGEELRKKFQNNHTIRNFLEELLEQWRRENKLRQDITNDEILSILDVLSYLDAISDRSAFENLDNTIQWLIKLVAHGITKNEEEKENV